MTGTTHRRKKGRNSTTYAPFLPAGTDLTSSSLDFRAEAEAEANEEDTDAVHNSSNRKEKTKLKAEENEEDMDLDHHSSGKNRKEIKKASNGQPFRKENVLRTIWTTITTIQRLYSTELVQHMENSRRTR